MRGSNIIFHCVKLVVKLIDKMSVGGGARKLVGVKGHSEEQSNHDNPVSGNHPLTVTLLTSGT